MELFNIETTRKSILLTKFTQTSSRDTWFESTTSNTQPWALTWFRCSPKPRGWKAENSAHPLGCVEMETPEEEFPNLCTAQAKGCKHTHVGCPEVLHPGRTQLFMIIVRAVHVWRNSEHSFLGLSCLWNNWVQDWHCTLLSTLENISVPKLPFFLAEFWEMPQSTSRNTPGTERMFMILSVGGQLYTLIKIYSIIWTSP